MLSTVDQGTFQTQECNSTRLTRVLRLRKKQQWVIKGFTFSHWHQCTGCLLHQWPLKGALWGWTMSSSHTKWLWIPHIWAFPVIKPLGKDLQELHKGCQSTLQPWSEVPIQSVVQHLPVHWVGGKAVLEWQQLMGFLEGTEEVKPAGKGMGLPSPLLASPTAWAGGLFPLTYWAIIVCSPWRLHPWYLALIMKLLIYIC